MTCMSRLEIYASLRQRLRAVGLIGSLFAICFQAGAEPADYLVDKWDTEDGLPSSTVTSMAQTPDGYLWIGTYNGLSRFDGARFVTFDPVSEPALSQARVQGLYLDPSGTLWINTFRGGLTSYRHGVFHQELADLPAFDIHTSLVTTNHGLTFVTQFGEVFVRDELTEGHWFNYSPPDGNGPDLSVCGR